MRVVAAGALAVLVIGCFRLPAEEGSAPREETPTTEESPSSLEGAFDYGEMDEYVDAVVPMISQWSEETWPDLPGPSRVQYVPRGASGREACETQDGGQARYTSKSYEYCGGDQTIYVGQDMLWALYEETGDAGPAVGIAHEWGHHIQQQFGVPAPQSREDYIAMENQADCLAGAWVRYTDQQKWLELPDDIEDIELLFPLIGSAEGPDRDHGTTRERMSAWQRGFERGVGACNLPGS
jgi:predicted metalloprotease